MKHDALLCLLVCTIGLLFSHCTEKLDEIPITSKTTNTFYKTEIEIEEAVTSVYAALQRSGLYGLYIPAAGEVPSDNTTEEVPLNDDAIYSQLDQFNAIPTNNLLAAIWKDSYAAIQLSNIVLHRIDPVEFKDSATKNARIGEAKFIRALLYFNLVRLFGDVPLVVEEIQDPSTLFGQGRTSKMETYKAIIQDLKSADSLLPAALSKEGRAIKTTAEALLGKVFLTLKDYANAKIYLEAAVASNVHDTVPLSDLFSVNNELNKEIIFAVQFASGVNNNTEGGRAYQQFSPSSLVSGAKGHNLPTKNIYDAYDTIDKRRDAFIGVFGDLYFSKKISPALAARTADGPSDVVVLRYADVLLMLAEVENELGNLGAARSNINIVRKRAGLSGATAATQAQMRSTIELERRLELVGEGHRWFDLLRTDRAIEVMNAYFKTVKGLEKKVLHPNHLLMPIPQTQIDTDPSLTQNPGY